MSNPYDGSVSSRFIPKAFFADQYAYIPQNEHSNVHQTTNTQVTKPSNSFLHRPLPQILSTILFDFLSIYLLIWISMCTSCGLAETLTGCVVMQMCKFIFTPEL
jgi:hypothetical protein